MMLHEVYYKVKLKMTVSTGDCSFNVAYSLITDITVMVRSVQTELCVVGQNIGTFSIAE